MKSDASMAQLVHALWPLSRDIISDGYDTALEVLAKQVPLTIHEYPTGTECWTWIVPEKWTCHEAYLETMAGDRLFSYTDNPLHVVSYSLPFEETVSRDELFGHLHVHSVVPDAVPFVYKYYERDWGLCCSQEMRQALTDDYYRVVIRTSFSDGILKVGEVVVPGETDESFVLCAHLDHPAAANDGLSGVAIGVDVIRHLLQRTKMRHTYRLLVLPETIGSVAYLSHNEDLIPKMKCGLFLEALGLDNPHALQLSFSGLSEADLCFSLVLEEHDPQGWTAPFRSIIGNDERQFNSPGVRVPMLSLSRVLRMSSTLWPYREYHSGLDTPAIVSESSLCESRDLVIRMIDAMENNWVPLNKYRGEVCMSRYGLEETHPDTGTDSRPMRDVMHVIDGSRSITDIARACGISFTVAWELVSRLHDAELVEYLTINEATSVSSAPMS